jgi:hypothetical protein
MFTTSIYVPGRKTPFDLNKDPDTLSSEVSLCNKMSNRGTDSRKERRQAGISVSAPALKIHESRQDKMLNVECIEGCN